MNALLSLVKKDLRLAVRGHVVWLALATVIVAVLVGRFVDGRDLEIAEAAYLVDDTGDPALRADLEAAFAAKGFRPVAFDGDLGHLAGTEGKHLAWLPDEATLEAALDRAELDFGAVLGRGPGGALHARYLMPDALPGTTRRLMASLWDEAIEAHARGGAVASAGVPVDRVGPPGARTQAPLGETFVPVFLFGEAFLIGIWLGAVLVFMERSERSAWALAVTPRGVGRMLTAKLVALGLVVVLEVVLTVVPVFGLHPGLWPTLAACLLLFVQALGLAWALAGWFESLSSFTLVGAGLSFVASLPVMSFFSSSFPDLWWMPTWPLFRTLREAFFSTGRPELIASGLLTGALIALVFAVLGAGIYRHRLARA